MFFVNNKISPFINFFQMFSLIFDKLFLQLNLFEQNLLLCFKLRLLLLKIKHLDFHPLDITHGASIIPFKIAELIPYITRKILFICTAILILL